MSGANPKGARATRGQLALVGVLAVVLIGVIANNFRGNGAAVEAVAPELEPLATEVAAPSAAAPTAEAAPTAPVKPAGPFGEFAVDQDWPELSLETLVEFDPLATPAWVAAPTDAETPGAATADLEQLQQATNAIIFVSGGVRVARIGDQDYHVGDAIGPYRITDISSAGIVLSEPQGDAGDR